MGSAPTLLIPLALEWVLLITTLAPIAFTNRFTLRPRLGLAVWFSSIISAVLATGLAFSVAIWSYFDTLAALTSNQFAGAKWFWALAVSFGPWVALALGGVSLVLIQTRLEPAVEAARQIAPVFDLAKKPFQNFHGVPVFAIDLPFAFAVAGRDQVIISTALPNLLNHDEFEAVLWHEVGHVRGHHFEIKKLARLVRALSPRFAASKALVAEVERLCELSADAYALKHKTAPALESARAAFNGSSF